MNAHTTSGQIELFAIRASELADRVAAGQISFIDAVDMAYSAAVWSGLIDSIGDDAVQKVMQAAFANINRVTNVTTHKTEDEVEGRAEQLVLDLSIVNAAVDAAIARIKREQETKEALAKAAIEYRAERERKEGVNGKANGHDAGNKTAGTGNTHRFNWRDHVFTAAELQRKTFPPVSYCVPDLIPGGPDHHRRQAENRQKLAGAGYLHCHRGGVSAWANASQCRVTFSMPRWRTIRAGCNGASTGCCRLSVRNGREGLTLANSWRRLDKGGVDDIRQWIEQAEQSPPCHPRHIGQREADQDAARLYRGL